MLSVSPISGERYALSVIIAVRAIQSSSWLSLRLRDVCLSRLQETFGVLCTTAWKRGAAPIAAAQP